MENWKIHCDRNGDGIVNDDEEVGNVNVITKANSNYCNVKKTASDVIKCTKLPTSTCLCDTHFETLDFQKLFKQEAKKDISIKGLDDKELSIILSIFSSKNEEKFF